MNCTRIALVAGALSIVLALGAFAEEEPIAFPACTLQASENPPRDEIGAWNTVTPAAGGAAIDRILGMQTVHTVLLPSGKILMISGSSWRNLGPIQTYPDFPDPASPQGIFMRDDDPFRMDRLAWYYQLVNNAAIYDPVANTFYRIPHPVPVADPNRKNHFLANDFFCIGQQHLRDGNVLFTGGTQYYAPYRGGNPSTWIFDWKKELGIDWRKVDWRQVPVAGVNDPVKTAPESYYPPGATKAQYPWTFAGQMKRGRWYPSLLPLLDGRMAVFSGFVGFDYGFPPMYVFQINHYVEFFDYSKFDPAFPQAAWRAIDVKAIPNSPFTVEINPTFQPTPQYKEQCGERCRTDNKYDAFKLYPENYLMPDGRIYLTREGDWVSLRTCDTRFMRRTKNTYWATIGGTPDEPSMSFERGPDRAEEITSYGTSLLDPNSGKIEILGGQPTSAGTIYPLNAHEPTHFAGGRGSRKMETFYPSKSEPGGGHWTLDPNFLGTDPMDDRTMHYSIILPTKQILIINGGNYDFYGPVFHPWLLTPKYEGTTFKGYDKKRVAEALEPRHYHNTAVLLPDATVFVSGGQTVRPIVTTSPIPPVNPNQTTQPKPNLDLVDLDVYFFGDGPIGKALKGMHNTPAEDWTAEIYSPPYMFIDSGRQASINAIKPAQPVDYESMKTIGGKAYYLIHSGDSFNVALQDLPQKRCTSRSSLSLIKLPSATHGWENGQQFFNLPFREGGNTIQFKAPDAKESSIPPAYYMMFYVDCLGKPAKLAAMVRFDDAAKEP